MPPRSEFKKYSRRKKIDKRKLEKGRIPKGEDERRTMSACRYDEFGGDYELWKAKTPLPIEGEK